MDPLNGAYEPLLLFIERSILDYAESDEYLTDGQVMLALDRMAYEPACNPFGDKCCACILKRNCGSF